MAKSRRGSREPKKSRTEHGNDERNVLKKTRSRGPEITDPSLQSGALEGTEISESPQDEPTSATAPFRRRHPSRWDWFRDHIVVPASVLVAAAVALAFFAHIVTFESRLAKLETRDNDNSSSIENLRTDLRSLRDRLDRHLDRGSSSE